MRVTEGWIDSVVYSRGTAVTKRQLEILGMKWPPEDGWKKRAEGIELTDRQARMFENISIGRSGKIKAKKEKAAAASPETSSLSPAIHSLTFDDLEPADMPLLMNIAKTGR